MSQELKRILIQDIQNIDTLRKGSKLTEAEHNLMKAGEARLLKLVNDTYPDDPTLKKVEAIPDGERQEEGLYPIV